MPARHWGDLKTQDFVGLDPERTVAVLSLAAIEQHGPHLPVSVDTKIMIGMIAATMPKVGPEVDALFLPIVSIGKSNEHLHSPGTLTVGWESAIASWIEMGESVLRAGIRKIVLVTSHGGNLDPMKVVTRELRVRHAMLAAVSGWRAFGLPPGLYSDVDVAHGIHAGEIETSLMLHFRPDLVDMAAAKNFEPIMVEMERDYKWLRPTGAHAYGWMAQDVHPSGAAGNASLGTAEKGRLTADLQSSGFAQLLADMARFPLDRLWEPAK
jgi:creatinine amidohydrolase